MTPNLMPQIRPRALHRDRKARGRCWTAGDRGQLARGKTNSV